MNRKKISANCIFANVIFKPFFEISPNLNFPAIRYYALVSVSSISYHRLSTQHNSGALIRNKAGDTPFDLAVRFNRRGRNKTSIGTIPRPPPFIPTAEKAV